MGICYYCLGESILTNIHRYFLGILITTFLNISNNPSHLVLRIREIQIVALTRFVLISDVGMKRVECIFTTKKYDNIPASIIAIKLVFS